jgi:hypothetical protein
MGAVHANQAIDTMTVYTREKSGQMRRYAGAHCEIYDLSWFLDGWWMQVGRMASWSSAAGSGKDQPPSRESWCGFDHKSGTRWCNPKSQ